MFDGARNHGDPGLAPLHADRLALAMRDVQIQRRPRHWRRLDGWQYLQAASGAAIIAGLTIAALVVL